MAPALGLGRVPARSLAPATPLSLSAGAQFDLDDDLDELDLGDKTSPEPEPEPVRRARRHAAFAACPLRLRNSGGGAA